MDKKLKEKWVKALESGRYKQGRGRLKRGDRYCCLGVLRSLMPQKLRSIRRVGDGYISSDFAGLLRPQQLEAVGLTHEGQCNLAHMNDGIDMRRHSFKEIADHIKAKL